MGGEGKGGMGGGRERKGKEEGLGIKVCTLHFGLVREPDRLSSLTQ